MQPLAERLRPKQLSEYIGQSHLVGEGAILRKMIDSGKLVSFILWGPPGVGKTTLARIIAKNSERPFYALSAVNSSVKQVREVIDKAEKNKLFQPNPPILFIDEIHRFSKSQQDSLLAAVENGTVVLVGATTENPSFEVITPLLSRCQVYVLESLSKEDLTLLLHQALQKEEEINGRKVIIKAYDALFLASGGDARKLLNALELILETEEGDFNLDNEMVVKKLQKRMVIYDKKGDMHYDIISAFIKSIRGSDPDAAVYWLARMVEGGEDPKFIARRLIISAAEDIGLANPNALLLANTCFDAVSKIGFPEARIILSQVAIYLATSPKSNSAYEAINNAMSTVKKTGNLAVPLPLRNAPTTLMKDLGYGKAYKYPHDYPNKYVSQAYLPDELSTSQFWVPQDNPTEIKLNQFIYQLKNPDE